VFLLVSLRLVSTIIIVRHIPAVGWLVVVVVVLVIVGLNSLHIR